MPKLDELQRQWLDTALHSKGRFTRAASIKKDWEDYRRRRDKAEANSAGLPKDDPRKALIEAGLAKADGLAEAGKFSDAYKSLDSLKKMGEAASKERAKAISIDDLRVDLNVLDSYLNDVKSIADYAAGSFQPVLDKAASLVPCSTKGTLDEAVLHRKTLVDEETVMLADLASASDWAGRANKKILAVRLGDRAAEIERLIALHIAAGHQAEVAPHAQRLATMKATIASNGDRYTTTAWTAEIVKASSLAFDKQMKLLKDLSKFKGTSDASGPDAATLAARSGLRPTLNSAADDLEEEDKLTLVKQAIARAGFADGRLKGQTTEKPVRRNPDLKTFNGAQVFDTVLDDVFGKGGQLPDDVAQDKANAIVTKAAAAFKQEIAKLAADSDELFDLMVMSEARLARMCAKQLAGIDNSAGFSASHQAMFAKMAEQMRKEVLASSPNKMKDDGSEIEVNGKKFTLVGVAGKGANGAVRRYTDGKKTFVVKSLFGVAEDKEKQSKKFEEMAGEMRTHRQVMNDTDDTETGLKNVALMTGAAVSEDGSLHMMLEDAEGGDVGMVGNNFAMLQDQGVLTDEARKALSLDMIMQTVQGMKALQERGLVHNDLKPQNMMLSKDGTIKIIDFGESRFLDEQTGRAPNIEEGGYKTTNGYVSPEHAGGKTQGVDSKADSFALGGIVKILMDPSMSENSIMQAQKPVGALGRLTSALTEKDPTKRPSLDAVLMSSMMDQLTDVANPEDVDDLKKAAAETNLAMGALKGKVSKEDMAAYDLGDDVSLDAMWVAHLEKIKASGGEVPIAALQTMVTKCDDQIRDKRNAAKQMPRMAQKHLAAAAEFERKKKFWQAEVRKQMDAHRAEGKIEIENAISMKPPLMMKVPGDKGGTMTLKDALKLRDDNIAAIKKLQADFVTLVDHFPEKAQFWLDESNKILLAMDAQNQAINAGLIDLLGPKGKYYLAEQKLNDVSARFGPRRKTGDDIAAEVTPKPPPRPSKPAVKDRDDDDGNDSRESGIPDPPPRPAERKAARK